MRGEVYADLLFLINFSMDFLCLYLTSRFLRRRMRLALITSAAIVGGIYSVVSLFLPFGKYELLLCDIAVCALICAIAFHSPDKAISQFIKEVFVYLLISMTLGGIMTALFNLLNRLNLPLKQGGDSISSWLFLLLAIISGLTALGSGNILRRMSARRMLTVKIEFDKKSVTLHGMTDTGNVLRDPRKRQAGNNHRHKVHPAYTARPAQAGGNGRESIIWQISDKILKQGADYSKRYGFGEQAFARCCPG